MICFRDADATVILAALEHYRVECTSQRVKCGGSDYLRGAFIEQEDAAAKLIAETREQMT